MVQEAGPKLMDIPASPQGYPKSELQTSLLEPLLRRETEAWGIRHGGLWNQVVQGEALDLPCMRKELRHGLGRVTAV